MLALVLIGAWGCAWKPSTPRAANVAKSDATQGLNFGTRGKLAQAYARLPLSFEANTGQNDAGVKFMSRGAGYTLFLTGDGAVLALKPGTRDQGPGARGKGQEAMAKSQEAKSQDAVNRKSAIDKRQWDAGQRATDNGHMTALTMSLVGGNRNAQVTGLDELPGRANYFIGDDPAKWRTNVPTYSRVKYEGVYPGVDLVYYGNQGRLEYDFLVAPGADPNAIGLALDGGGAVGGKQKAVGSRQKAVSSTHKDSRRTPYSLFPTPYSLHLAANGDLLIEIDGSELRFQKPVVYQPGQPGPPGATDHGQLTTDKTLVEGHYRLIGKQVKFEVGKYDHTRPLVIDPALSYSTYLGGSNRDFGQGIATDNSGNAYVTGYTSSTNFPVTSGSFETQFTGYYDVFVTKINPTGSALVYSTYLGGTSSQQGYAIAVNGSGEAFVTGWTGSTDFPTTPGAFQPQLAGSSDAFLTKLNASGAALVYSTYLGGEYEDAAAAIAIDSAGDAYLTGTTQSTNFPNTAGVVQNSCLGTYCHAGFVTELNPSGSALVYSTFLGGTGISYDLPGSTATGIAVDTSGNAYITGYTYSSDFPVTSGAFQTYNKAYGDYNDCCTNGFITKLNPGASQFVYSTYLGGSTGDSAAAIAIDASGDAYVVGTAGSSDFPVTPGAFQTTCLGCEQRFGSDGFVTKLNPDGTALVYSSFLGGSGGSDGFGDYSYDGAYGVGVDSAGDAYVTGVAFSANFPTTLGSLDPTVPAACSYYSGVPVFQYAFLTELNPAGSGLVYSTFLGSGVNDYCGSEWGNAIAVNPAGKVFVAGVTYYDSYFPTTPGAYQKTLQGTENAFVSIFTPSANAAFSPGSLSFPLRTTGTTSSPQTVVLTNTGNLSLAITAVKLTGTDGADFTETNNCGSSLAVGASCTINVSFAPLKTGTLTANLGISDTAPASPQTVPLTGQGTNASATLSPPSLVFPAQVVFTTSSVEKVRLFNAGTGPLTITSIVWTYPFSETNTCGSTIEAKNGCTIDVSFAPTTGGVTTGSISITDNAPGSPQVISLSGTGNDIELSPTKLNFGTVSVGTTSAVKTISVENKSTASVSITSIAITGADAADFTETNNCGSSLVPGEICTVNVAFSPTVTGPLSADVTIIDNGGASPQTVVLSGTGD